MAEVKRGMGASRIGVVVSDAMDKTVTVRVDRIVLHPRYKRYVRRSKKFMAHDEKSSCRAGDTVEILETRPLSARKRWRVRRVVKRAAMAASGEPAGAE